MIKQFCNHEQTEEEFIIYLNEFLANQAFSKFNLREPEPFLYLFQRLNNLVDRLQKPELKE